MAITASSSQTTQRSPIKDPELSKAFRKYDLLKLNPEATVSQVRRTGNLELITSKRVFDLQLVPHDLRSKDYRSQVIGSNGVARTLPDTPVNTYKGVVSGLSDAQVRMTITNNSIEGSIITKSGRYFIQPARSFSRSGVSGDGLPNLHPLLVEAD